MEDRLEPEIQIASVAGPSAGEADVMASGAPQREISAETKLLISRCMDGSEPLDRPLKDYEPTKLSNVAVNAVMLKAAGFRGADIERLIGMQQATVSIICNHPYGKKILHSLLHEQGSRVLDIKTRLAEGASRLMNHALNLALMEADTETVAKVTFGFLDRAGFGPTQKHEHSSESKAGALSQQSPYLSRIATALEQSDRINTQVMPTYKQSVPPEDAAIETPTSRDPFADEENPRQKPKVSLMRTGTDA